MTGHVWLVGAGPGNPELLTLAGARALAQADLVLYDALIGAAVLRHAPPAAERRYVGKRSGAPGIRQDQIEALMIEAALSGRRVVRLKGGDPFVFGRGGEEALACQAAGVAFTVVPGVTSAVAAAAYAGIPVTHRGLSDSFLVVTGADATAGVANIDWAGAARAGTVVILMGVAQVGMICAQLIAAGRDPQTPAAAVEWGTLAAQRRLLGSLATLPAIAQREQLGTPAAIVVGRSVALAKELAWYVPGPLAGRRVAVTRSETQSRDLIEALEAAGATVVEAPVIGARFVTEGLTTDERVSSRWDWLVFASANGVEGFFRALEAAGKDARWLSTTSVAAIGPATAAALKVRGVIADFVPSRATAEALGAELPRVSGARVLLPCGNLTDNRLVDALRARKAHLERATVYETVALSLPAHIVDEVRQADAVIFASPSAVSALQVALGECALPAASRLISIGPLTSRAVLETFGRVDSEARAATTSGLLDATREALV